MKCSVHLETDAVGACVGCGTFFCASCLTEVRRKKYCRSCVTELFEEKDKELERRREEVEREKDRAASGHGNIVVTATGGGGGGGGASSASSACAAAPPVAATVLPQGQGVSKILCVLLAIFVPIGVHRMIMGRWGSGIAQLLLALVYIGILWSWIDVILILTGSLKMADGRELGP